MFHHVFRLARLGGGYEHLGVVHRLPQVLYLQFSFLGLVVAGLGAAGLLVFLMPALHRKGPTLLVGLTAIACGTVAAYGLVMPNWQHAEIALSSPLNTSKGEVLLAVRVGLSGTNFTVAYERPEEGHTYFWDQRLEFDSLEGMRKQVRESLANGLPNEVLQVEEQMAGCGILFGDTAFLWPYYLRKAGYYSSWVLAAAIVSWAFTLLLLMALPQVGAFALGTTGFAIFFASAIYWALLPAKSGPAGHLMVNGIEMPLHFGPCFWVCFAVGLWTAIVGFGLGIYHSCNPEQFFTDFEVDYDALNEKRRLNQALVLEQVEMERTLEQEIADSKVADTMV